MRSGLILLFGTAAVGVLAWALSTHSLEPADFRFANGADIKSVDPAIVTGNPEGRIIYEISEGLYRNLPADRLDTYDPTRDGDGTRMIPQPAAASGCTVSEDGRTYTFTMRPTARWSDGSTVTAHDFAWSWKRFLHPDTPNQYVYQLTSYVQGAKEFNAAQVRPGDRVEIELPDRLRTGDPYPSGTMLFGILRRIVEPPEPHFENVAAKEAELLHAAWRRTIQFEVDVVHSVPAGRTSDQPIDWDAPGERRTFVRQSGVIPGGPEHCLHVLPHFESTVGIRAMDAQTFEVRLIQPTAYFLDLCGFYVLYPVHRGTVERYGFPAWTRPEHLVTNGPYTMEARRIRDRIRLRKSETYWNAGEVGFTTIDAFAISSQTTMMNMYANLQLDWIDDPPQPVIPDLRQRPDWQGGRRFGTYFYRLNVTRPPLDNVLVRRALNQALDKSQICDNVTRAGETPARSLVPPGVSGYVAPWCGEYNVKAAQALLAQAGYPAGRGFPKLEVLYNTSESHRAVAEVIQQQWSQNLGIQVELRNREWKSYLDDVQNMKHEIARAAWIGDYPDPNTFLDMFVTQGPNNNTGWGHPQYDAILTRAQSELDPLQRWRILAEAEEILMAEVPILPIYFYASKNLVRTEFNGFRANLMDVHPLHLMRRQP